MPSLVQDPTRILFFTGKGGVGKTSSACATAIELADAGGRVLLVSTDPASNLDEVLGVTLSATPAAVPGVENLRALNIDPVQAAHDYRERIVGPYRGVLPDAAITSMEEQLSGACTVEIAAFDEFSKLLGSDTATADFDHVVFDTAPTGHTLRLLELPSAWTSFIDTNVGDTSCLGPLSGLSAQKELYAASNEALRDGARTTLVLVARPESSSLAEAERTRAELAALGVTNVRLILNGVFRARDTADPTAVAMEARGRASLEEIPAGLARLPRVDVELLPFELLGVDTLRRMGGRAGGRAGVSQSGAGDGTDRTAATDRANDADRTAATDRANDAAHTAGADRADRRADRRGDPHTAATDTDSSPPAWDPLDAIIEELAEVRSGVVMTMGKGGVGKTTVAARIALGLARRGLPVTLTTTDPAAHVEAAARGLNLELALELELDLDRDRDAGADPGTGAGTGASSLDLRITRIDPQLETRRYSEEVLRTAGADLDAQGRALLEEDLRSPCTEEIAVFRAFADTVAGGADRFVVIDTAPTGHTLLLLDAAEAYHREVLRKPSGSPDAVLQLLPRLRDPSFTHLLLVTLPEATPIHEAMQLERDLARADITPSAWVVNQSLTPLAVTDPVLLSRQAAEALHLEELGRHAGRIVLEPWEAGPGTGTMTVGGGSVPAALA